MAVRSVHKAWTFQDSPPIQAVSDVRMPTQPRDRVLGKRVEGIRAGLRRLIAMLVKPFDWVFEVLGRAV